MREMAEEFTGDKISSAVLTVPAYFSNSQRRSAKIAAKLAKLHVLGIVHEPTAAALAFGINKKVFKSAFCYFCFDDGLQVTRTLITCESWKSLDSDRDWEPFVADQA